MRRATGFTLNFNTQDLTVPGTYYSQALKISASNAIGVQIAMEGSSYTGELSLQVSYDPLEPVNGNPTPSSTMIGSEPAHWSDVPGITAVSLNGGDTTAILESVETTANWARAKIVVDEPSSDLVVPYSRLVMKGYGIA